MIKKLTLGVGLFVALTLFIPLQSGKESPPPPPEEPVLPTAPYPKIEPIEPPAFEPIEEPKPLPPQKEPDAICTDDCPLIDPEYVEREVRSYYADVPVLAEIARCESRFRHYDESGEVLMNEQGSSATGVMQIMASVHEVEAEKYGWNLKDFEGNMAYARKLYEQSGTKPWEASAFCWQNHYVQADGGNDALLSHISDA